MAALRLTRTRTFTHGNSVYWAAFSPDGSQLATASLDNTVKLWNVADGTHTGTLKGHGDGVAFIAWLSDQRLLTASLDRSLKLWKLETATAEATFSGHQDYLSCAAINRQGTRAASGGFDK
ncbi:MAG TPA: hypothetical protein VL132_22445, partial [Planctomycetaceae bacterium]|nr:hypothetical protein [Planctomycetaceae bacterium]